MDSSFRWNDKVVYDCDSFKRQLNETLTPWKSEHFGMVVLEAMSAKCVPIVARKGALPEFVKHGQNGFLFDNLKELENWTLKLMKNEELREEMGINAVLTAKKFDKEIFRKRLLRIIKKLMK